MSLQDAIDVLGYQAVERGEENKKFKIIAGLLSLKAASIGHSSPALQEAVTGLRNLATRGEFDMDEGGRGRMAHLATVVAALYWRREHSYAGHGGMITFHDGVPTGWVDELRDSRNWRPGCIAVSEAGDTWITVQHDEQHDRIGWRQLWADGQPVDGRGS